MLRLLEILFLQEVLPLQEMFPLDLLLAMVLVWWDWLSSTALLAWVSHNNQPSELHMYLSLQDRFLLQHRLYDVTGIHWGQHRNAHIRKETAHLFMCVCYTYTYAHVACVWVHVCLCKCVCPEFVIWNHPWSLFCLIYWDKICQFKSEFTITENLTY